MFAELHHHGSLSLFCVVSFFKAMQPTDYPNWWVKVINNINTNIIDKLNEHERTLYKDGIPTALRGSVEHVNLDLFDAPNLLPGLLDNIGNIAVTETAKCREVPALHELADAFITLQDDVSHAKSEVIALIPIMSAMLTLQEAADKGDANHIIQQTQLCAELLRNSAGVLNEKIVALRNDIADEVSVIAPQIRMMRDLKQRVNDLSNTLEQKARGLSERETADFEERIEQYELAIQAARDSVRLHQQIADEKRAELEKKINENSRLQSALIAAGRNQLDVAAEQEEQRRLVDSGTYALQRGKRRRLEAGLEARAASFPVWQYGSRPGKTPGFLPGEIVTTRTLLKYMQQTFAQINPGRAVPSSFNPQSPYYIHHVSLSGGLVYIPGGWKKANMKAAAANGVIYKGERPDLEPDVSYAEGTIDHATVERCNAQKLYPLRELKRSLSTTIGNVEGITRELETLGHV
jgi:hypothetical protein